MKRPRTHRVPGPEHAANRQRLRCDQRPPQDQGAHGRRWRDWALIDTSDQKAPSAEDDRPPEQPAPAGPARRYWLLIRRNRSTGRPTFSASCEVGEDRLLRCGDGEEIENATDSEVDAHQHRDVKKALLAEGGQGLVVERLLDVMLNSQLTRESEDKLCLATELFGERPAANASASPVEIPAAWARIRWA